YTPAYKLAAQLAGARGSDVEASSGQIAHWRLIEQTEDKLRAGTLTHDGLEQLVQTGKLNKLEAKEARRAAQETRDIADPMTARLFLKVRRLPMADALQVWELADNQERGALAQLMREKRLRYRQAAFRDLTSRERAKDPTWAAINAANFGEAQ
ncbi:MAG: hypothetical protein ACRD3O_03425, partial [Terriglobia bacterium]